MNRSKVFLIMIFTLSLVLAGGLAAQNSGSGWPSAAQLTEYGISGFAQPAGTTGAGWRLQPNLYEYPAIYIWFSGSAAANTAAKNYFRDWKITYDRSQGGTTETGFEKDGARVNYKYDGKEIMIFSGVFASGTWPGDSVWRRFGLSGLSRPPDTLIESVTDDDDALYVYFASGGITAYSNIRGQLIAKGFKLSESEGDDNDSDQNQSFYNERIKTAAYLYRYGDKFNLDIRVFK